jgi:ribose transport system ATP-binding protein
MTYARDLPLATLRIIDLARALAAEPEVLLLDEMTAALPADLSDSVLKIVGDYRQTGRSVVFISHRLLEIKSLCDRATVLRDGETVGVLDMGPGAEDEIVSLMLGPLDEGATARPAASAPKDASGSPEPSTSGGGVPRLEVRDISVGTKLRSASFELFPGEVLGLVGLEGQGQDELFDVMAGARKPDTGELLIDGKAAGFGHPADAIAAGIVYVPANRAEALLPQRSVRENIALPFSAPFRDWGPINMGRERKRVDAAIERLQIDTRAQGEVSRLSGGNQQKVTIARWIAGGVQTMLCFDPTRGIDIRTKRQIYQLLRDLAAGGAAVILYTSELEEIQAACDRTLVIFGGEIVDEMPASEASEAALMRAAHGLQSADSADAQASGAPA